MPLNCNLIRINGILMRIELPFNGILKSELARQIQTNEKCLRFMDQLIKHCQGPKAFFTSGLQAAGFSVLTLWMVSNYFWKTLRSATFVGN